MNKWEPNFKDLLEVNNVFIINVELETYKHPTIKHIYRVKAINFHECTAVHWVYDGVRGVCLTLALSALDCWWHGKCSSSLICGNHTAVCLSTVVSEFRANFFHFLSCYSHLLFSFHHLARHMKCFPILWAYLTNPSDKEPTESNLEGEAKLGRCLEELSVQSFDAFSLPV